MSWASWFGGGRRDHKETARDSIVNLRGQLLMLEKREEYIQKQIDEEMRKARANATTNKRCKWDLSHCCVVAKAVARLGLSKRKISVLRYWAR